MEGQLDLQLDLGPNGNGNGNGHNVGPTESLGLLGHLAEMDEFAPATATMPIVEQVRELFVVGEGDAYYYPTLILERRMKRAGLSVPMRRLVLSGLEGSLVDGRVAIKNAKRQLLGGVAVGVASVQE